MPVTLALENVLVDILSVQRVYIYLHLSFGKELPSLPNGFTGHGHRSLLSTVRVHEELNAAVLALPHCPNSITFQHCPQKQAGVFS